MKSKALKKWLQDNSNRQLFIDRADEVLKGAAQLPAALEGYTKLIRAVRWETPRHVPSPISGWNEERRMQLIEVFIEIALEKLQSENFIPQNIISTTLANSDYPSTVISESDAWRVFVSHVATCLYMEISGLLSWSMRAWSHDELAMMLDSRSYFSWSHSYNGYWIDDGLIGQVTPTDARWLLRFIRTVGPTGLIAGTAMDTIANGLEWCRHTLTHFGGGTTVANMQSIWQYRGFPPIVRMIGTQKTAGCWATTGFLKALFRVVNIPVKAELLALQHKHI